MADTLFKDMLNNWEQMRAKKKCKKTVTQRIGKLYNERTHIMSTAASFEGKIYDTTAEDYISVRMRKIREMVKLARYLGGEEMIVRVLKQISKEKANIKAIERFHIEEERRQKREGKKESDIDSTAILDEMAKKKK